MGERHGDDHALLHPAGQLVRIPPHHAVRVGDLDLDEHCSRPRERLGSVRAAYPKGLGHLVAHPDRGIERRSRVLIDHRNRGCPKPAEFRITHLEHVGAIDADRPTLNVRVSGKVLDDGEGHGRLAAARLADQTVRIIAADAEGDSPDGVPIAAAHLEGESEVVDLEDRIAHLADARGWHRTCDTRV